MDTIDSIKEDENLNLSFENALIYNLMMSPKHKSLDFRLYQYLLNLTPEQRNKMRDFLKIIKD